MTLQLKALKDNSRIALEVNKFSPVKQKCTAKDRKGIDCKDLAEWEIGEKKLCPIHFLETLYLLSSQLEDARYELANSV